LFPRFICYPISLQKSSWEFTLSLYFSANDWDPTEKINFFNRVTM
jgi:hypothetical protein